MYIKKTNNGWESNMVLPSGVKNHIVKLITDMTVTKLGDVRVIAVKQGNEEHPDVYCETTGEALTEGIYIEEGWAGYAAVQDKDATVQVNGDSTSVYFGVNLIWHSSFLKLNREAAQKLILLNQQDIVSVLENAYIGNKTPDHTSINTSIE